MVVRSLKRMATAALLAGLALPSSGAAIEIPPRKVEINKFTCGEFSSLATGEERDRVLIYMNGYLDGTRKTAVWDAGAVGKRVDEVLRLCREDPKLTVINAFKRAWRQ
jgi:HdeA/HdeB family protein